MAKVSSVESVVRLRFYKFGSGSGENRNFHGKAGSLLCPTRLILPPKVTTKPGMEQAGVEQRSFLDMTLESHIG